MLKLKFFFFQAEDGIRYPLWSRGLGDVYKRQLSSFVDKFGIEVTEVKLEPGDAWVVHHVEREVVGIDFLPAPKI